MVQDLGVDDPFHKEMMLQCLGELIRGECRMVRAPRRWPVQLYGLLSSRLLCTHSFTLHVPRSRRQGEVDFSARVLQPTEALDPLTFLDTCPVRDPANHFLLSAHRILTRGVQSISCTLSKRIAAVCACHSPADRCSGREARVISCL